MGRCASPEAAITYRDTYFHYWTYWGGLFKLHLLNGDLDAAGALARRKFAADKWYSSYVASYLHGARGECAQAAAAASRVLEWGPAAENIPLLYFLAQCQLEHGLAGEAVESLLRLQALYSHMTLGTAYYARSLMLLGEAYERKGDPESAARSYSRLLDLWREGDADLPHRLEALRRLERLKPMLASGNRMN
jgi:tetratricopeptide (TPR) repeat protein